MAKRYGRGASAACPILLLFLAAALLAVPALAQSAILSHTFDLLLAGTSIDLTAEGKLDWGHWGFFTEKTYNHKYGLAAQISYRPIVAFSYDGPYWLNNAGNAFQWTDGTPMLATTNTSHGIFFIGVNHGFELTCPADTSLKTLKLYVGADGAQGRFTAHLSGRSVPGITNTAYANPASGSNAIFTVDFQAASAQTLTVAFTMETNFISEGSVILQAATLTSTSLPPTAAITSPADGSVFVAPAEISLTAVATDGAGSVTNLEIEQGTTLLARADTNWLSVTLSNQPPNTHFFTVGATDNRGLSVTSAPVTVYVTTGGGTLLGSLATPPTNVDLTAEGITDWAHWGLLSSSNFDHKANVSQQIPDVVPVSSSSTNLNRYGDNFTGYTWTDGTPTVTAASTPTGIFTYDLGNGFQLTVPANDRPSRLKIYVGLYGAQGKFEAALSDGSAPPYTDTSMASAYDNAYGVYTLTFASRLPAADLVVRWTSAALFDETYGNVTWQAATLAPVGPNPPDLKIAFPPPAGSFAFHFSTQAGTNYAVLFSDSLAPQSWQPLTNLLGNGTDAWVADTNAVPAQRFYRVKVLP